jgi:hypothetical protein
MEKRLKPAYRVKVSLLVNTYIDIFVPMAVMRPNWFSSSSRYARVHIYRSHEEGG